MGLYTEIGAPKWHNAPNNIRMAVEMASKHCKERGVNLSRLALYFSASFEQVDITIVSMATEEIVHENVSLVTSGLTDIESQVLKEIRSM